MLNYLTSNDRHNLLNENYRGAKIMFSIFFAIMLFFIFTEFAHTQENTDENIMKCEYYLEQEKIICIVASNDIVVKSAIINNGECISPLQKISEINTLRKELNKTSSIPLSLEIDFRNRYKFGDQFYLKVDPNCQMDSFEIMTNKKNLRWQINHLRRLIYPNPLQF